MMFLFIYVISNFFIYLWIFEVYCINIRSLEKIIFKILYIKIEIELIISISLKTDLHLNEKYLMQNE